MKKQHRVSFSSKSKKKLELVHSDVYGLMDMETLRGNKYFFTFIDDPTRKVWIYLLRLKDQVFQCFLQFHVMVEIETGKKLKYFKSCNGGEYISRDFETYCTKKGIKHEKIVSTIPQHNEVAKRRNLAIIERVRCILKTAKLSKVF